MTTTETDEDLREIQVFDDLFAEAQYYFQQTLEELRAYGIEPDPNIELRRSTGMQSYYNLQDGHIYVAVPDIRTSVGRIYKVFVKSVLSIDDDEDLLVFLRLIVPRVIAHELGHHLRHCYAKFSRDNLWHEEQVANQLAMAVMKRRLRPEEKQQAHDVLSRAISVLSTKMESKDIAIDSYDNIVQALNVTRQLGDDALDNIELMRSVFSIDADSLLRASGQLPEQVMERIENRDEIIDQINEEYTSDSVRYMYYHLGWLYCDLLSPESNYVDEFAIAHLGLTPRLLPLMEIPALPERIEIRALYRAYQDVKEHSEIARRYFYKRYRSCLLYRLENSQLSVPGGRIQADLSQLLEMWDDDEQDPLTYLELVAPPEMKKVFRPYLTEHSDSSAILPDELPTETDRRLWRYFTTGEPDEDALNTLSRLEILERTPMLRPLPAEVQLWLAHRMYRLKLSPGEPIIWAGEKNTDIFILIEGKLEILVADDGSSSHVGSISPGEMFGEMAFITREARSATVRALKPSDCFILKGSDLRPMAFNHPALLVQMARTLADKLNRASRQIAQQQTDATMVVPKAHR